LEVQHVVCLVVRTKQLRPLWGTGSRYS